EIPGGRVDKGESPEQAAARETLEETGWRPGPLRHLTTYHPNNGQTDLKFHVFFAAGAEHIGAPSDPYESERIEWVPVDDVRRLVAAHEVHDGLALTGLLWWMALGS